MNLTIQTVDPETREWEGPNGTLVFIQGQFTDGTGWSLGCKPETQAARIATLQALIGVPGEYELEPKGEYRGVKQFKIKNYPGKPVFGGGGGGGNKAPRDETGMAIGAAGHDAAVLIAAMIGAAGNWLPTMVLETYDSFTKHIYQSNQSLRATTLPVIAAETGTGVSPTPVPTTSPAGEGSARENAVSTKGIAGDDRGWGAKPEGKPTDAPCSHVDRSPLKPDGSQLPSGFMRCLRCGAVAKS